ncbi:6-phospho-beta-glucosidase [Actinocatenispora rupis]|uniref:6-phospho-beta-glucosidase n=1 Tax=Actinocatenispora rupis TaxID=519421 RepID=A0A8J3IT60_9ACTN|nr:6-phospho-beta-glucosidase [Actinocatenispora rupis]GID09446.1 6-phospho-beta-glucosidase [Actinocatenispora rupis]
MKLAILGGGGFRVPYVYRALLRDTGSPRVDDVWLYDTDPVRLDAMVTILAQLADGVPDAPRVTASGDLSATVAGSDFVFAAIRVGGTEGRTADERVALDLGVLGQETTGPGGIAYGLRTIPVMLDVARTVRELAPEAYVINFTNPAGMITEAMQSVLGERVLGICDTPSGLGRRVAGALGVDPDRVQLDYVGLNHLGWLRRVVADGVDLLPRLLADDTALAGLEEADVFGTDWLRALGCVPNEYLYYYYRNRDAVRAIVDSGETRGEFLVRQQREFYATVRRSDDPAGYWQRTIDARSAAYMAEARQGAAHAEDSDPAHHGYAAVALDVMAAISRNRRATMILNVRNGSTVPALPPDAVVEVPALVDANGVHPLATAGPDLHQAGLMQQVKAVERATIEAATTGSRAAALRAFALHPLVDSLQIARRLVDGYAARIPEIAAVLSR